MNPLLRTLNSIKYDKLIWVLAITETIHIIEEAIWLPDMFQSVNGLLFVSPFEFRLATLLVTLLIWWIIWYFVKYKNKLSINLMGGLFSSYSLMCLCRTSLVPLSFRNLPRE